MKKVYLSLALIFAIALTSQISYSASWCGCNSSSNGSMSFISYLNPLQYFGIGENRTNFSLNPFTGFKNCDRCNVKRVAYCNAIPVCNMCQMPIIMPKCNSCHRESVILNITP